MAKRIIILLLAIAALQLSACSRHPSHQSQGYIEGRYTYIATNVSGILKELFVDKGSKVEAGQQLFVLEKQPESDLYAAAQEELKQSEAARDAIAANLVFAKLSFQRNKVLVPKNALQQSELDRAKSNYDATLAQLEQANASIASAKANLAKAEWTLKQKTVIAPVNGIVFQKFYRLGEYTEAAKPVLSLLAPEDIKAIFYVREPDLGGIHLQDKIAVQCDACKQAYEGRISFISPSAEYTPPVIFSNETNAKLLYRIEAKFAAKDAFQLHPGQPVKVTYQVND